MLVTFETNSYPRITMFGDVAVMLLQLMGQSGSVPGAIAPEDIDDAVQKLSEALDDRSALEEEAEGRDDDEGVGIRNRARPLIELLHSAARHWDHVTWVEGRSPP